MAREDRDSQYGGGSYSSENNRSDRGQSYGGGGGDAREQRRSEQYTSQTAKDLAAGVGSGGIGTLADPREKMDYFGSTVFGPSRKYTGSFLDNILGRGYRAVQPYAPDQFQSRLSQAGGFGKSIFGGILGLLNPFLGMAYRIGTSLPSIRGYDTLADYARGEFGLFQRPGVSVDQGRGSGLRPTGIMQNLQVNDIPPGMDLNDYERYRDRQYIESAPVNTGILDIIDYTDPYQGGTYG
jgi:hypothetical protein